MYITDSIFSCFELEISVSPTNEALSCTAPTRLHGKR